MVVMNLKRSLTGALLVLMAFTFVDAQEVTNFVNQNSVRPIPEYEQFYKKRVWRRMDLQEKQNEGFFASGNEITQIIIDAVDNGILTVYENDSFNTELSKEEFHEKLKMPGMDAPSDDEAALGFGDAGGWGDDSGGGWGDDSGGGWGDDAGGGDAAAATPAAPAVFEFLPRQISILHICEDVIFDRRRSRLYYDIQGITLVIPANKFETGVFRIVGTFKYKDLDALFRSMPEEAIWFNRQNSAEHRNLADAFLLRLFHAPLFQVENPKNEVIADIYGEGKNAVMAAEWQEMMLMEKEHNLWEY